MYTAFGLVTALVINFIFTSQVLAGGQIVSLSADNYGWSGDAGFGRVLRVYLNPEIPCKNSEITFKFVDPKDGDLITTASGNATYVMQEDRSTNGCGTYAKMTSKNSGSRLVTLSVTNGSFEWKEGKAPVIKVDFDGKYYPDNEYGQYRYRSSITDPYAFFNPQPTKAAFPNPSGELKVWELGQEKINDYSRRVTVKWNALEGSIYYNIYVKDAGQSDWQINGRYQKGPSYGVIYKTSQDFYIKLQGCLEKYGTCVDSNELYIPKLEDKSGGSKTVEKPVDDLVSNNGDEVGELNKKLESLQSELAESKKRQVETESRLNTLINWLKSIFPFFGR